MHYRMEPPFGTDFGTDIGTDIRGRMFFTRPPGPIAMLGPYPVRPCVRQSEMKLMTR
jgi:hypothetical protein